MTTATIPSPAQTCPADAFIRQHFAGGIGDPDTGTESITTVLESIWRIQDEGRREQPWQRHAFLRYEEGCVLWASGSRRGALVWLRDRADGATWRCYGFDAGTSADLAPWATHGLLRLPEDALATDPTPNALVLALAVAALHGCPVEEEARVAAEDTRRVAGLLW
jgi:hypothetical protein